MSTWCRIYVGGPWLSGMLFDDWYQQVWLGPNQWFHDHYNNVKISDGVSTHRRLDCLLNRMFRCKLKITSKLRVTGLCEGNPPVTGGFPPQRASYAENVFIWWRYHDWDCHHYLLPTSHSIENSRCVIYTYMCRNTDIGQQICQPDSCSIWCFRSSENGLSQ